MPFDKPVIHTSNPYKKEGTTMQVTRTIYFGEVVSIDDEIDGGRIKVRVQSLDAQVITDNLPWCYPLMPKFFHIFPQVGEIVRIFIEDPKYPDKSRFWLGSVISQPHKIGYDGVHTALSTTSIAQLLPSKAPSTYPDAKGVFPDKNDVGIIGKVNTDVLLKPNQVYIRAGKHENENILKLNTKNPAEVTLTFEPSLDKDTYQSNTIIRSDKIAFISHVGNPQFKTVGLTTVDRDKIFETAHPIARGDVLVEALEIMKNAIINHIHGYSNLPSDKTSVINELEKINFDAILQKNIVIN